MDLRFTPFHEMEPILDTTKMAKNLRLERSWDYGKSNTFILLNEYRSKVILMNPAIIRDHSIIEESALIGKASSRRGNWKMCRERGKDFGELSPK